MLTVLIRLLTLNAENVIPEVIWALGLVYCLAVLLTVTSIWSTYKNYGVRIIWVLFVIGAPFVGVMAHCLHCLTLADLSSLKQFGIFSRKAV